MHTILHGAHVVIFTIGVRITTVLQRREGATIGGQITLVECACLVIVAVLVAHTTVWNGRVVTVVIDARVIGA